MLFTITLDFFLFFENFCATSGKLFLFFFLYLVYVYYLYILVIK